MFVFFSWKWDKKIITLFSFLYFAIFIIFKFQIIQILNKLIGIRNIFKTIPIYNTNEKMNTGGLGDQAYNRFGKPIIGFGPSSSRHHCKTMNPENPIGLEKITVEIILIIFIFNFF